MNYKKLLKYAFLLFFFASFFNITFGSQDSFAYTHYSGNDSIRLGLMSAPTGSYVVVYNYTGPNHGHRIKTLVYEYIGMKTGTARIYTRSYTNPNGSVTTVRDWYFDPCTNWSKTETTTTPPPPPVVCRDCGMRITVSGDCDCRKANVSKPKALPTEPSKPADQNSAGTAFVSMTIGTAKFGTNASDIFGEEGDSYMAELDETTYDIINLVDKTTDGYAKPHDVVTFKAEAQAAYIAPVGKVFAGTENSLATVTADLTKNQTKVTKTGKNGATASITQSRTIGALEVGKTFTVYAHAQPISAKLRWTSTKASFKNPDAAIISENTCQYNKYKEICESIDTNNDGSADKTTCKTVFESGPHTNTCKYISDYKSVNVITKWDPVYTEELGPRTRSIKLKVEHNYEVCVPGDPECPNDIGCPPGAPECPLPCDPLKDPDCQPPPVKKCNEAVEICAPGEPDWPNYSVAYPGEDTPVADPAFTRVRVLKRYNKNLKETYATNTRPSTYEIISFVTAPDSKQPGKAGRGTTVYSSAPKSGSSCSHYTASTKLDRGCVVVQRQTGIHFNTRNNVDLNGSTDTAAYNLQGELVNSVGEKEGEIIRDLNPSIIIDDLPPGSKVCTALSVWPAGSHDNNAISGLDQDATGSVWKHGAPYCRTIAKKPTVQFWGADIYSGGSITTSQSVKYVPYVNGFTASSANTGLSNNDPNNRRAFGSWSEYAVIAGGTIKGIGSGAALGYNPGTSTSPAPINGSISTRPGGFPTTYSSSNTFTKDKACSYSRLTISNTANPGNKCAPAYNLGNSKINTNVGVVLERLVSRYATTTYCSSLTTLIIGSSPSCSTSTDGTVITYASEKSNVTLQGPGGGNINVPKGKTYTISVPGKLTIASNIIYNTSGYNNIADLPQVVIFADRIDIAPNVTQIDAWLVVGENNSGSTAADRGVLNTCNAFTVGSSTDSFIRGSVDAGCQNQLTINGPVFARKLLLNRTAGADKGYDSINPAERFNLRADSYFWSYAQAQRYSQAVVTYTRELAPRY